MLKRVFWNKPEQLGDQVFHFRGFWILNYRPKIPHILLKSKAFATLFYAVKDKNKKNGCT